MTVLTLLLTGSNDTLIKPVGAAFTIYEQIGSVEKSLVTFENADHMIFWSNCQDLPWVIEFNYWACSDSVWDLDRAHDLINHFVTAFLLAELNDDTTATAVMAPENIIFPGIRYQTTAYNTTAP